MERKKLHAKLRSGEAYSFLRLRGVIDEDNNLSGLVDRLGGDVLVVDASEVDRINSCGVRDWVNWLIAVEEMRFKVILIRCAPPIVTQINLVTNFVGDAVVHSFFAPYYCPECDREVLKLIETESLYGQTPVTPPSFRCGDCGGVLEFDDIEEAYFAFINAADPAAMDKRLRRLVDEVSPDLEAKIRALNEAGSSPLSGPLHTVGTLGSVGGEADEPPPLPAAYLDIDEEETRPPQSSAELAAIMEESLLLEGAAAGSSKLMVAFVASAILVIGLLIYLALTGV
jgi:anti-anti-sigma regulatory factor